MSIILALLTNKYIVIDKIAGHDVALAKMIFHVGRIIEQEVRVHAKLACAVPAKDGMVLYYLCRALDKDARGVVKLPLNLVCGLLGITRTTLLKYLNNFKLFSRYKIRKNFVTVFYRSLFNVCKTYNVGIGYVGYVLVQDILDGKLKQIAVEITTLGLQAEAYHSACVAASRAKKANRKQKELRWKKLLPTPADLFVKLDHSKEKGERRLHKNLPHILEIARGAVILGQNFYVDRDGFIPYGVSQTRVALELGLTRQTVNSLLKPVRKLKQFITGANADMQRVWDKEVFHNSECGNATSRFFETFVPGFYAAGDKGRHPRKHIWQTFTCLYYPEIQLTSMRTFRSKLYFLEHPDPTGYALSDDDYLDPVDWLDLCLD